MSRRAGTQLLLSHEEQLDLSSSLRLLLSPLSYESAEQWQVAVNRSLKRLLDADMASFILPVDGKLSISSEEFDPEARRAYPNREPELPGRKSMWERQVELVVWSRPDAYAEYLGEYYRSEYYNEYIVPIRAFDAIGLTIPLGKRVQPSAMAGLLFHHEQAGGRCFGERGLALLRLILPAFEAGVGMYLRMSRQRETLARTLDALGRALLLSDLTGRVLHQTPMLGRLLATDPEGERLDREIRSMAQSLSLIAARRCGFIPGEQTVARNLRTGVGQYRLRGSYLEAELDSQGPSVLICVERLTPDPLSDEELREQFRLTKTEIRVVRKLAEGRSNAEIAEVLVISPRTAERHTENILRKTGLRSRAEVAAVVLRAICPPGLGHEIMASK